MDSSCELWVFIVVGVDVGQNIDSGDLAITFDLYQICDILSDYLIL